MNLDKRIIILLIIIAVLAVGVVFGLYNHQDNDVKVNNTTVKNNTVKNATMTESTTVNSESGQYGYCAICGKALTYEEAHDEYTQGEVCHSCAADPYYETPEGADYANEKLQEAYPDEYSWMDDDSSEDYEDYDEYE